MILSGSGARIGTENGRKTVALKAIGLLALMAQSGLLIRSSPRAPSKPFVPLRRIGDEQSIRLSTFRR